MRRVLVVALLLLVVDGVTGARRAEAALPDGFVDEAVALVPSPTAFAFLPDGRPLVTSQTGTLWVVEGGVPRALWTIGSGELCSNSERGLLGVAVDPGFASNRLAYLYYTRRSGTSCTNRVVQVTLGPDDRAVGEVVLLDAIPSPNGNHNGGDLGFGRDGELYVAVGDGGPAGANRTARNPDNLLGKIHRLTRGDTGWSRTTFATGLRNPFRMAFDPNAPGTRFYVNDVGQNAWEEVNEAQAGADYGWNLCEGRHDNPDEPEAGDCTGAGNLTPPIHEYSHATGCRSITGGAFVPDGLWDAQYDGAYLYGDYVCGKLFRLAPDGTATQFADGLGPVVSLGFGPADGGRALYYVTYTGGGALRRIRHTGPGNRPPAAALSASPTAGPLPLAVVFDAGASADPDGDALGYRWDFGDGSAAVETAEATTTHTYERAGSFTASVVVTDARRASSAPASVTVEAGNTPPDVVIGDGPTTYRVGERLELGGSGTDGEDGPLVADALSWRVTLHHDAHTHPLVPPTSGETLAFTAPPPEDLGAVTATWLEVELTATDSRGTRAAVTRRLDPRRVDVVLRSDPAGLLLRVNGTDIVTPATVAAVPCYPLDLEAPEQRAADGTAYGFAGWSDGGAQRHRVLTGPAGETVTATFAEGGDGLEDPGANGIARVAGGTRVATAVALSAERFPACGDEGSPRTATVVLARADAYADALAGGPLAFALGGPVLVTDRDALHDEVRAEIERLGATRAVLLGGTAALGAGVEADVRTMGLEVQRLAGGDRFETAGLVAAALPPGPEAFVVEGSSPDPRRGWPDAVSASWLAARSGAAILLATRDALPAATAAALRARGTERVIVVGGSAAISADVARQVGVIAPDVERVGGSSRYDTARALAERSGATDGLTAFVTTGEDFPDALAVGPTVAARAAVLLTVHGDDLAASPATAEWLHTHRDELAGVVLVGGTDAVSAGVEQAIRNLVDQA